MESFDDVFISYGRADSKAFAINLRDRLVAQGLSVWLDQSDIPLAVDFQEQIKDGIARSHNFLFVIAPHAVNSPYCAKEIELAIQYHKRIIPILHVEQINQETWQARNPKQTGQDWDTYQAQGLHSSFVNMNPTISKINWVYFRENIDDFEVALSGLIEVINLHKAYVEQHTYLLLKALDWIGNQRQTNYLLIGEERQAAEAWLGRKFTEQPPCIPTDLHCELISESIKNANNLLTQVFLSSSEGDNAVKDRLRRRLMREGMTLWTNQTDIKTGVDFKRAICEGIEGSNYFVYLLSAAALGSDYCQAELAHALQYQKPIIPILIEPIDLALLPVELRSLQFIDWASGEQDAIDQLLAVLRKEAIYHERRKCLLVRSLKWQGQNQNPSLLLRGYNLQQFEAWFKVAQQRTDYPPLPLQTEFLTASLHKPEETSLEVFISYSRADSDLARKINDALQELGKTTWFDQESIATGADFQQEIYRGIEMSDNFLFIISPKSVNSPFCGDEVSYAEKLNKRLITILHRPLSEADQKLMPEGLAALQWLDFNQHGGEFFANFNELVRTLDTDRDHVRSHTKWSQRSLEWEQNNRASDLLLRGSEFAVAETWRQKAETEDKKPALTDLQREFIDRSREAIAVQKKQDKRQILILRSLLAAAAVGLVAAIGSTVFAWSKNREAQFNLADSWARNSLSLFNEHQEINAFMAAIKGGMALQQAKGSNPLVIAALQQTIYEGSERDRLEGHEDPVRSVSISPDGKTLASGSSDNTLKLWNLETGKEIRTLKGHEDTVISVSISPDGKTLASGSLDNTIKLWNLETGKEIRTLKGHDGFVYSVSVSPDGKTLASGSHYNTIKLWHLETGKEIRTLKGHEEAVNSVTISPDGKTLASGSDDKTIKLWNLKTGKEIRTLKGHGQAVNSVNISPDGKTLASGSGDNTIKLWNLETGQEIRTLKGHEEQVSSVSISPDGKTLASGSYDDKTIKLWNLETGQEIRTLKGHEDGVNSVSISPDGKTLASGSHDETIKLWNLETGKEIRTLKGHEEGVYSVSISRDGKTLASGSSDKTIKLWNLETGKEIRTLKGHEEQVSSVSISPDGKTLASGSYDNNTIKLWNLETGKEIRTLKGHENRVISVSISPDGKTLASGSSDKTIKLWNLETGKEIRTLKGHEEQVSSVSISPDGKTLASSSYDNIIKLWNLETGKEIRTLKGHEEQVSSVSISPDGKTLASGSWDGTIKLWNLETGKEIRTLKGHKNRVSSVSISPDGKTLASGSWDGTIKLWNLETDKAIRTLEGHENMVWSVTISPDGKTLASGSEDKTIKLWDMDLDSLVARNCDWVRNYLNKLPDSDMHKRMCDGIGSNQQPDSKNAE